MYDYVKIARPNHWFKNIFMIPGMLLALIFMPINTPKIWLQMLASIISACFLASANYTINEYLDAEFDRHHPLKNTRPSVMGRVRFRFVIIQYAALSLVGLFIAKWIGFHFLIIASIFLIMGIIYNVNPFRSKDRPYLDVLSESVNNPLRFLLGWYAVTDKHWPPSSILVSYWMGGAFLMSMKRYAEYRQIGDATIAGDYRRSFRFYTEQKLLVSSFFYAITSSFFLAIFLIKYKIEFVLSFPFIALLFSWYLTISSKSNSSAQAPEKLYTEKLFMSYVIFLAFFLLILFFINVPALDVLLTPLHYSDQGKE